MSAPFSLLNEDGSCAPEFAGLISDDELAGVLDLLVLNRILDRRLQMLQRQGRLGFYMTSRGEEATIFGVAMALEPADPIFLSYRELGCLLWRRVPLPLLFNQLIGNSQDLCLGRQMPVHYCFREWGIPSVSSKMKCRFPGFHFRSAPLMTCIVSPVGVPPQLVGIWSSQLEILAAPSAAISTTIFPIRQPFREQPSRVSGKTANPIGIDGYLARTLLRAVLAISSLLLPLILHFSIDPERS